MRILFIVRRLNHEPLGLMQVFSLLKNKGYAIDLLIGEDGDAVEYAVQFKPDIIAFSCYTGDQRYYLDLSSKIKNKLETLSIFGGAHPTYFPEIIEHPAVDAICLGEGDLAVLEFIELYEKGGDYSLARNWWVKQGTKVIKNPMRPLVSDLDTVPFVDRELLYSKRPALAAGKVKTFIFSRGCPFDCSYCFNHKFHDLYGAEARRVRCKIPARMIEEIRNVQQHYPLEFVVILDDIFCVNPQVLQEFVQKYKTEIGLPFFCHQRADTLSEERLSLLKEAGCRTIAFGVESGNERYRRERLNRPMKDAVIIAAAEHVRAAGINLMTLNMLGLPGGGLEHDFETLRFNIRCKPHYAMAFLFQPYPRTELGEFARKNGYLEGNLDDIEHAAVQSSIVKFSTVAEKRQIENLQRLFMLAVCWPMLYPVVRMLVKLPRNIAFWWIYKLLKGYALIRYLHPHKLTLRESLENVMRFWKVDRK